MSKGMDEGRKNTRKGASSRGWDAGLLPPLLATGLFVLLAGGIWMGLGTSGSSHHPEPREGLTGETVMPADRYIQYARVRAIYAQAAEIPTVLDGLYCHCDCSKHSDHRSLLTCFESDHGAACDICLSEAAIAYRMTQSGASLDEVREAIDAMYGT